MAAASTYMIPTHRKGDTFKGVIFAVLVNDVALDLTNAYIRMDMRLTPKKESVKRLTSETNGGITILDDGKFQINKQIVDVPAAKYVYDIEITLASGDVDTYIAGTWTIVQDVTYDE
jgi:hypothetical protein